MIRRLSKRSDKGWAIAELKKVGRFRFANRSGVPSGLSRFASQAKPLLTIAERASVAVLFLFLFAACAAFAGA